MLIYVDSRQDVKSMFAGLPSFGENRPKNLMQLFGRTTVTFMFINLINLEFSWYAMVLLPLAGVLMFMVAIGYKTKLCACVLVIWLNILNCIHNAWWSVDPTFRGLREHLRIQFFATLSLVGGLLMVVYLGPGKVCVDQYKKAW